ncbi:DUF6602 domain-containing protein [Paraburkholderia tropica]|uniref:DUF6602 domain-containing protein n=1 Tax=Paraburkholderia tropica TaxID=92647 RepID=UPI000AABC75E|nr:DUF6602 domain-containing protein [Paraburkholderia tropica]
MAVDIVGYLKSLTAECNAQKDRVRHFIGLNHLLSDGAWKESVLRAMISRTLPATYAVASGFIVTEDEVSTQIDVLIYDTSIPVLYKGGDLVFVPPSACAAVIEVKSKLNATQFGAATQKLADICELVKRYEPRKRLFSGLFAYEQDGGSYQTLLGHIAAAANGSRRRVVNHAAIGNDTFIKYWREHPESGDAEYRTWHHYTLTDMAPGYFLHNLMSYLARENLIRGNNVWFPAEGKEGRCDGTMTLRPTAPLESEPAALEPRRMD